MVKQSLRKGKIGGSNPLFGSMKTLLILLVLILLLLFSPYLTASLKVFLLISQQFPQIPLKPLIFLTNQPKHEQVKIGEGVVADLYLPNRLSAQPALILAMGVRTNEKDRPVLLGFAENLARLGYVTVWPRLAALDKEEVKFEQPQTFILAFKYLEKRKEINPQRISLIGFSVGSSLAMIAAENPLISEKVHSLVFFGGYFNIIDYFLSLAEKSYILDGQKVPWQPHEEGLNHAKGILESEGLSLTQFRDDKLLTYSPDQNLDQYKTPIFILHEKNDAFVPYVESVKLKNALAGKGRVEFHLANLFEHIQPNQQALSLKLIQEFIGLFGFLHKVFMFL